MTLIGKTWHRYTRQMRGAYETIKHEKWRAARNDATLDSEGNAYSYETKFTERGTGTPDVMRNAIVESLDENGIQTVNDYSRIGNNIVCETRRYGVLQFPTYEVSVIDATHGNLLRWTTHLTAGGRIIGDEQSVYDEKNRLRSRTYADGTSMTNAYSCCRLLWSQDRNGRKTLRSAATGFDHLYYADEEVWLGDVSTNGEFRIVRHYFDSFGRETNRVVSVGSTPGEAVPASGQGIPSLNPAQIITSEETLYPYGGSDYFVRKDMRRTVTINYRSSSCEGMGSTEIITTNGVEISRNEYFSYFDGGYESTRERASSSSYKSERQRRSDYYLSSGNKVTYDVTYAYTASSGRYDSYVVTNSVSEYDMLGRLIATTVPGANGSLIVTSNTYDRASSRVIESVTSGEMPKSYHYNEYGAQVGVTQNGITEVNDVLYEICSNEVWKVNHAIRLAGGITNSHQVVQNQLSGLFDELRSHTVTTDSNGGVTEVVASFDPDTCIMTTHSKMDEATPTITRSKFGQKIEESNLGERVVTEYDLFGREVLRKTFRELSDEIISKQKFEYNTYGDVIQSEQILGDEHVVNSYEYDMFGRMISTTDGIGNVTTTEYDADGRPVLVDGATYPIRTEYDIAGRKISSATTRDDKATWDVTQWSYDPVTGLNTGKTYADGNRIIYSYDDNGRKISTQWARGVFKENVYDERGLVVSNLYSDAVTPVVRREYEDAGKLSFVSDSSGTEHSFSRDASLAVTNEHIVIGGVEPNNAFDLRRTYDNRRRLNSLQLVQENKVYSSTAKTYDNEGRLSYLAITNAQGRACVVTYAYDGCHKTNCVITLPSGARLERTMTRNFIRPEQIHRNAYSFNGHSLFWYEGSYDLLGRLTNAVDSLSLARAYVYNMRSELSGAIIGTNNYAYVYDTIGNRITASRNELMTQYSANNLNQYSSANAAAFTYDLDGNLVMNGTHACEYDAENRLILVTPIVVTNGSKRVRNQYDYKHRRIGKAVESYYDGNWQTTESHTFIYDGWNVIAERISYANGASKIIEYFWGDDLSNSAQGAGGVGGLLAVSIDGAYYFPAYDFNGNITAYVSESGNLAAWYAYDGFGNIIDFYGDASDSCGDASLFSFRFSTKYHDTETGMYYYCRRFYLPHLGRWLNRDPIEEEGGENLYAFCRNNGILYFDFLGMDFWGYFFDAVNVAAGVLTAYSGIVMATATGATGAGMAMGAYLFIMGADQAVSGAMNIYNRIKNKSSNTGTPLQQTYRYVSSKMTGKEGSLLETTFDSAYFGAQILASCATAVISVNASVKSVKSIGTAHTAKRWVSSNGWLKCELYLTESVSVYQAGIVVATETFSTVLSIISFFGPLDRETEMEK